MCAGFVFVNEVHILGIASSHVLRIRNIGSLSILWKRNERRRTEKFFMEKSFNFTYRLFVFLCFSVFTETEWYLVYWLTLTDGEVRISPLLTAPHPHRTLHVIIVITKPNRCFMLRQIFPPMYVIWCYYQYFSI